MLLANDVDDGMSNDSLSTSPNCTAELADKAGPPPHYIYDTRVLIGLVLSLFPVLTLIGNVLVIVAVFTHKRLRTITNVFVVSLSVADALVAILVMPFAVYLQINNNQWDLGPTICTIYTCFDVMSTTSSIMHLSCLAVDRYLAICRPFLHERLNNKIVATMVASCWVLPAIIAYIPILKKWNHIGIEDYIYCLGDSVCALIVNIPFAIICSTIAFYIPAVFMIISNVKIYLAARTQARHIRSLEASVHCKRRNSKFKHETKAAKTIGIIMGCFCVCWFPFFIMNIIDPIIGHKIEYLPWTIALWLGYLNSMLNPFLYYNFNKSFKTAFRRILTCKLCRGVSEWEDEMPVSNSEMMMNNQHHHHHSHTGNGFSNLPTELSHLNAGTNISSNVI